MILVEISTKFLPVMKWVRSRWLGLRVMKKYLGEFLGSFILLTAIVGSGITAERLTRDPGLQLMINALSIVLTLGLLIQILGPISGAHLNPLVTMAQLFRRELSSSDALLYVVSQLTGGICGTTFANFSFYRSVLRLSTHERSDLRLWLGEVISTAGLIFLIYILVNRGSEQLIPVVVPAWIMSAIFFTSSTAFANPMVTISRSFTNTYTGISPSSLPMFLLSQGVGATIGYSFASYFSLVNSHHRRPSSPPITAES